MTPEKIIIHCSATPEGRDFSAADIDRWHRDRGFNKIGYHYVIRLDGRIERGRREDEVGAHCLGENARSLGICYIGGVATDKKTPKDTRTPAQKKALIGLINDIRRRHNRWLPVYGHYKFAPKACPCFNVEKEFPSIR